MTLDYFYELLGHVVLLPFARKRKFPIEEGWHLRTFADTQTPEYQSQLQAALRRGGNIGVRLGPLSEQLVTIDIDDDELAETFVEYNPALAHTLRTRGERGCNFWLRMKSGSHYPDSQGYYILKTAEGHEYGEWRVGGGKRGAQTVIFGRHPHDIDYQILIEEPPIEIEFTQLKWFGPAPGDLTCRILAYLVGCPGAVSGNGGHAQTLKVATQLVIGFDLGIDGARPWLREYNNKCEPPWNDEELEHKLQEAAKNKLGREAGAKIHGEPRVSPPEGNEGFAGVVGSNGEKLVQIPQITRGVILNRRLSQPTRF
jgi:hypothetical protein